MTMTDFRLEDLSTVYWLKDLLSSTFITVTDGYTASDLIVPSIAIEWDTVEKLEYELGNRKGLVEREYYIDIYAKNRSQRDEITYMILDALSNPIPVYDYNEGFPPYSPTQIGCLNHLRSTAKNIPVNAKLVEELYYRATVHYVASFQNNR
jgi:hypothetical protein